MEADQASTFIRSLFHLCPLPGSSFTHLHAHTPAWRVLQCLKALHINVANSRLLQHLKEPLPIPPPRRLEQHILANFVTLVGVPFRLLKQLQQKPVCWFDGTNLIAHALPINFLRREGKER